MNSRNGKYTTVSLFVCALLLDQCELTSKSVPHVRGNAVFFLFKLVCQNSTNKECLYSRNEHQMTRIALPLEKKNTKREDARGRNQPFAATKRNRDVASNGMISVRELRQRSNASFCVDQKTERESKATNQNRQSPTSATADWADATT